MSDAIVLIYVDKKDPDNWFFVEVNRGENNARKCVFTFTEIGIICARQFFNENGVSESESILIPFLWNNGYDMNGIKNHPTHDAACKTGDKKHYLSKE